MTKKSIQPDIESLFAALCNRKPAQKYLRKLRDYPDRQAVVRFLVGKLETLIARLDNQGEWDRRLEWGTIHACRLLGEFRSEAAIVPMIDILDRLDEDKDAYLYDAAMMALEGAGPTALEPTLQKCARDRHDPERGSTWLWVLALLGVTDPRIRHALIDHIQVDPREAVLLMGDYGDRELLPIVESFVEGAARYLNENKLDPFAYGARYDDVVVSDYIDARESLIMLRDNIPVVHPQFDEKVEALDRQLLRYADFTVYEKMAELDEPKEKAAKVGRNDPCPCGSGKKYKKCCGN